MTMADPHKITLAVRGKICFDPEEPDRPPGCYVYQRTAPGKGNIPTDPQRALQLRAWVIPFDPHTPAQVAQRATMRDGVAAWQALTPEAKAAWRAAGLARNLPAYNAFLSAYMKAGH